MKRIFTRPDRIYSTMYSNLKDPLYYEHKLDTFRELRQKISGIFFFLVGGGGSEHYFQGAREQGPPPPGDSNQFSIVSTY